MKINEIKEGLRNPKDNPCWKGYKPVGTKEKGGRTVPNCVPKESVAEDRDGNDVEEFLHKVARSGDNGYDMLYNAQQGKYGREIEQAVQDMYDNVSIDTGYHSDDDFEEIYDRMLDNIEADYGQQSDTNIRPGMRVSQGKVVKVDGNTVTVKTSNGDMMTMNIHDVDRGVAEGDVDEGRFYNPMDQERREQDAMDYDRRAFKRAELQHELGHEDDPDFERKLRQQQIDRDRGPWYIRIDGKVYRQRGEPKSFDWKRGANNYALAMVKNKPELQGKVMLTRRTEDDQPTIDESKNTVKVPVTQKPRQGPLRPQTGGGAHRDKKKEQKQGKEKHKKPFAESNYTADEMVDILSGKKTQTQVDAERKSKQPTATPAPTQQPKPKVPEKSVKEAGELKVQKDDDKATVLLNPATGVQTQIDKTNPNAPRLSQDETGKLKLSAPQAAGGDQEKPNFVGKDVTVDQAPVEAVSRIGASPEQPDGEVTDVNPRSPITGDEDHDEISKLLNQRLRKLAGIL